MVFLTRVDTRKYEKQKVSRMQEEMDFSRLVDKSAPAILSSESISKAIDLFESTPFSTVIVKDEKEHVNGVATAESILRLPKFTFSVKKGIVNVPLLKSINGSNLLRAFVDNTIDLVPVVDRNERLLYIVSIYRLASELLSDFSFASKDIIEPCGMSFDESENIQSIISGARRHRADVYPILEKPPKKGVLGVLRLKKLLNFIQTLDSDAKETVLGDKKRFSGTFEPILKDNPENFIIIDSERVEAKNIVKQMEKNGCPTLFVLSPKSELLGLVRLRSIFRLFLEATSPATQESLVRVAGAPDANIEAIAVKKVGTILQKFQSLVRQQGNADGSVRFRKIEHQSKAGMFAYETEIRISFGKGKSEVYSVSATDFGSEKSLNKAFSKLSRVLSDKRQHSKTFAKDSPKILKDME